MTSDVLEAVKTLERNGYPVRFEPGSVTVYVGALRVECPDRNVMHTQASLDGIRFERSLRKLSVTLEVGNMPSFEVWLEGIP